MPLRGGMLDLPKTATSPQYPPEVEAQMRQMGIWPPNRYPIGSRQGREEAEILQNILAQYQRSQELGEGRAFRQQQFEETAADRRERARALDEYRQERLGQVAEAGGARRAQMLQYLFNDPNLSKEEKARVKQAMLSSAGAEVPLTPTDVTKPKGEYGPGGAPMTAAPPPPTSPADVYSGTPMSTAQGGGGTPEAPRPLKRYFQPSRYAEAGLTPQQLARAAANLDRVQAADEEYNMLAYKRDIGDKRFADIYGTTSPELIRPGMPPAAAIPQIYGGPMTIPEVSKVGYYGSKGEFLGPLYTETGEKLPKPKGATGIRGTASLQGQGGLRETAGGGGLENIPDYLKPVIAGRVPAGQANVPTAETVAPTPVPNLYRPTEGVFGPVAPPAAATTETAPTGLAPSAQYNIRTGFTPEALASIKQFINLPKTGARQRQLEEEAALRRYRTAGTAF